MAGNKRAFVLILATPFKIAPCTIFAGSVASATPPPLPANAARENEPHKRTQPTRPQRGARTAGAPPFPPPRGPSDRPRSRTGARKLDLAKRPYHGGCEASWTAHFAPGRGRAAGPLFLRPTPLANVSPKIRRCRATVAWGSGANRVAHSAPAQRGAAGNLRLDPTSLSKMSPKLGCGSVTAAWGLGASPGGPCFAWRRGGQSPSLKGAREIDSTKRPQEPG